MVLKVRLLQIAAVLVVLLLITAGLVSAAIPPAPCDASGWGTDIVDGDPSEWNSCPKFADMRRAGKSDGDVLATLKLAYNCDTGTLYALVQVAEHGEKLDLDKTNDGVDSPDELGDEHWIKNGTKKLVSAKDVDDDSVPDWAWINREDATATADGWEASATLAPGSYNQLDIHSIFIDDEGQDDQTASPYNLLLSFSCETIVALASFGARSQAASHATTQTAVPLALLALVGAMVVGSAVMLRRRGP